MHVFFWMNDYTDTLMQSIAFVALIQTGFANVTQCGLQVNFMHSNWLEFCHICNFAQ